MSFDRLGLASKVVRLPAHLFNQTVVVSASVTRGCVPCRRVRFHPKWRSLLSHTVCLLQALGFLEQSFDVATIAGEACRSGADFKEIL